MQDGRDHDQCHHGGTQLLGRQNGGTQEELTPQEHHDGEREGVKQRSFRRDVALSLQPASSFEKRPRAVSHKARKAQEGPQNERCAGGATDVKPSVLGTRQRVCEHGCTFVKNGAHVARADRRRDDDAQQPGRQGTSDEAVPCLPVTQHSISVGHDATSVDGPRAVPSFWKPLPPHHRKGVGEKTWQIQPERQQTEREEFHVITEGSTLTPPGEPLMIARRTNPSEASSR